VSASVAAFRRSRILRAAVWLLALLALLILSPAEQTLGQIVKLVYLHGALVRTGMLAFTVAGVLGVFALLTRRSWAVEWTRAVGDSALVIWTTYVLSSMLVTYLAWGVAIAWSEPRVRASGHILLAAVAFWGVSLFLRDWRVRAVLSALLGVLVWVLITSAGVVIHPVDPIGGSASIAIKVFYGGIVACVVLLAAELALWMKERCSEV